MLRRTLTSILVLGWAMARLAIGQETTGAGTPAEHPVSFNRDVRPILARHCFKCHGPDDKARKAKLRLDRRDDALKEAGSGMSPIVPGRPDESELVSRIFSEEDGERMPPPQAKLPLSEPDKQILKRWVAEGAKYEVHWAFQRPSRPAMPVVKETGWPRNAIDTLVLSRLEREGLRPSSEADPIALIRRVSLDLIGLPPNTQRGRCVRPGPFPGCLRKAGGPAARLTALRRTLGTALARPGPVRGYQRLRKGSTALDLAVSRLGDPRLERRPIIPPIHHRPACRRPTSGGDTRPADRDWFAPEYDAE